MIVTNVCVTVTSAFRHYATVTGMPRGFALLALVAAGGCATGDVAASREAHAPPTLTVLLQRGALASAALTLDGTGTGRAAADDALPDPLRPGAARRYLGRAIPSRQKGELAVARLGPGGRLVGVAIGDFSGPVVVVDDGGARGTPEVLLDGGNVRLLVPLPRRLLRDVTVEPALLATSPRAAATAGSASIRLGSGLPIERMGPASASTGPGETGDIDHPLVWVRYRDPEVEATGVIAEAQIGKVYRESAPGALTAGDADVPTPLVLLDRPSGRPFATIWRPAGRLIPAARFESEHNYTRVRIDLSRDVTLTGWIRSPRAETTATDVHERARPAARGQWFSVAGLPGRGLRCVELARSTRLHDRPAGPVTGLVTRGDRFVLLSGHSGRWIQVGVGHPFGLARLWVADQKLHRVACDPSSAEPGTT